MPRALQQRERPGQQAGLRLTATRLAGSAVHPVSSGPNQKTPAHSRRPQHPARALIARAASEMLQTINAHPERRRFADRHSRIAQDGRRSACRQSGCVEAQCRIQSARGARFIERRTRRSAAEGGAGPSATSAPPRFSGRCGVSPLEGVAGDAQRLRLRGKPSPPRNTFSSPEMTVRVDAGWTPMNKSLRNSAVGDI